jgi:hypothetical protein
MKTRILHSAVAEEKMPTQMTRGGSPTSEEIRQRAHEIFMPRGGAPGEELDKRLRAEQAIKQQRARRQNRNDLNLPKERHVKANAMSQSSSRLSPDGNDSDHLERAAHESETTRIRPGVIPFWFWLFLFLLLLLSGLSVWLIQSKL